MYLSFSHQNSVVNTEIGGRLVKCLQHYKKRWLVLIDVVLENKGRSQRARAQTALREHSQCCQLPPSKDLIHSQRESLAFHAADTGLIPGTVGGHSLVQIKNSAQALSGMTLGPLQTPPPKNDSSIPGRIRHPQSKCIKIS